MALDYNKFNHLDNFELKIIEANKDKELYLTGKTGYEQYYVDLVGFWRELYNPGYFINLNGTVIEDEQIIDFPSGYLAYDKQADLLGEFYLGLDGKQEEKEKFYSPEENPKNKYWNKQIYENPELLNFWLDFLNMENDFAKYSNKAIGNRPVVKQDGDISAIYYKNTPNIIFVTAKELSSIKESKPGYKYFNGGANVSGMFSISAQKKSAKDMIDELLYNHSYGASSINISTIPIYYLEPNTRIYLYDKTTNIEGDYIIDTISIDLKAGSLMSINAHQAPERLM